MSQNPWGSTTEERRENLLSTGLSLGVDPKLLHNRPMSDIQKTVENAQSIQKAKSEEADAMGKFIDDYLGKKSTANAAVNAGNNPAQPIVGLQMMQIGAGGMIQQNPPHAQVPVTNGGGNVALPFQVYSSGINSISVRPSVINSEVPTMNGTPLTATPPPSINANEGDQVYIHIEGSLTVEFGYVTAYEFTSFSIEAGTMPSNDSENWYAPLALLSGGIQQLSLGPLAAFVEDDGSGDGTGNFYFF